MTSPGDGTFLCSDATMRGFVMGIIVLIIFPNYFEATLRKQIHGNRFTYIYTRFPVFAKANISVFAHMPVSDSPDMDSIFADRFYTFVILSCIYLLSFILILPIKPNSMCLLLIFLCFDLSMCLSFYKLPRFVFYATIYGNMATYISGGVTILWTWYLFYAIIWYIIKILLCLMNLKSLIKF